MELGTVLFMLAPMLGQVHMDRTDSCMSVSNFLGLQHLRKILWFDYLKFVYGAK